MTKQILHLRLCVCVCARPFGSMYFCLDSNPKGDISLIGGNPSPLSARVCVSVFVLQALGSARKPRQGSILTSDPWLSACSGVMHIRDADSW